MATAKLAAGDIERELSGLSGWRYVEGELAREYRFADFVAAFGFIAQLATLMEQMNHHATITNTWANVAIRLSTHDAGGVTERDFKLARAMEERAAGAK